MLQTAGPHVSGPLVKQGLPGHTPAAAENRGRPKTRGALTRPEPWALTGAFKHTTKTELRQADNAPLYSSSTEETITPSSRWSEGLGGRALSNWKAIVTASPETGGTSAT